MTRNALLLWPEILGVVGGGIILLLFGLALAIPHRPSVRPGSRGHRQEEEGYETVRPDGYIDTFGGVIEEGGGSFPPIVWLLLVGIIAWWVIYLVFNFITGGDMVPTVNPQLGDQIRIFFLK
jgi:hypothetical protein